MEREGNYNLRDKEQFWSVSLWGKITENMPEKIQCSQTIINLKMNIKTLICKKKNQVLENREQWRRWVL